MHAPHLDPSHPAPVDLPLAVLACPACHEPLEDDRDGTSCDRCGGLLVARVWAERCRPLQGRAVLPPVFIGEPRERPCPGCHKGMVAVLCHDVPAWSCARCRWLFFEGARRQQWETEAPIAPPRRELVKATLLAVVGEHARRAPLVLRDVVGLAVLTALAVAVILFEVRG